MSIGFLLLRLIAHQCAYSINHYVRLYNEKRAEQRHLHVGQDKLGDTVTQVEELQKSLASKQSQLEASSTAAAVTFITFVQDLKKKTYDRIVCKWREDPRTI